MGFNDTVGPILKKSGPMSLDELKRKGPPTREEIDALGEKYGMGMALSHQEQLAVDEYFRTRKRADHVPTILSILYPTCEWGFQSPKEGNEVRRPDGSTFVSHDHDSFHENLIWDEDNPLPKPTKSELKKMEPFVQDILDQQAYIDLRRKAYPGEQALIRALWEYVVEGNSETMDALQARRLAVKKRFPKPENKHWMVQSEEYLKILPNTPEDILRQIDEETAKKIAYGGLVPDDVDSLVTRKTLEQYAEEALAKRRKGTKMEAVYGTIPEGQMRSNPTLKDIEEEAERFNLPLTGEE